MTRLPAASRRGFDAADRISQDFSAELLTEAGRIAKRYGAEQASPDHVRAAAEHLYRSGASHVQQAIGSAGGLVAGISGGVFFNFLQAAEPSKLGLGLSAAVTVIGASGVVVSFIRRR